MAETLQTALATRGQGWAARWYACYTKARHEKRVEAVLRERGYESYLPLVSRESQWKDRRKTVEWPLFPSYVFGRFNLGAVHDVLSIPGVSTLVTSNGQPVAVGEEELENVRRFAQALRYSDMDVKHTSFFAGGQWVLITAGLLAGVSGVVVERRGRRRVRIGLKAIGQGLEVDVDVTKLQPVPAP